MRAADVAEALPTARMDDGVLPAVRMVARHRVPGLAVADEHGHVVTCVSSVDLLRLVLPRHLWDEPCLARVFDEAHADRVAGRLVGVRIRDVVAEVAGRVPVVRPEATVVELVELMTRSGCPLALVGEAGGRPTGIVTANRLLDLMAAEVENAGEEGP
ncbi:CBS domain-containing protein [Actinophytocola gossypii]|uniref:CBS domain-containing protein n=1 Tax=Actinophytocola gossypii TaxID=2812003 RepID=A0ABT2J984_9PSEU|nr:CBS domain-containing protein [Actinophytocola gossypii]MCT2584432.1 CBS domain-containing protein [Actinophytocola gossypii]